MSEPARPRWVRVGASGDPDSAEAAREAVTRACREDPAALVILFVSPSHDLAAVAKAASAAAGNAELVGCSTSGEIGEGTAGSGRVVAIAMGGEGLWARARVGFFADGPSEAGRAAAQGLVDLPGEHQALVLLSEGLAGYREAVVRAAYGVGGAAVQLVGGCAGDELAMTGTWQIHGDTVHTGAVIGAAIGSDGPIGVGVGHGWRRMGDPVVVTESDGQQVFRLDDEPALDVYLERASAPPEALHEGGPWQNVTLLHPLGLPRPSGDEVRAVLGANFGNRSLLCSDVPQGSIISMMEGDKESVLAGTEVACREAISALRGATPLGFVAFDCAARRAILGDDGLAAEMATIAQYVGDTPVGGFYTYGEVARRSGSRGVHNATLVMLALG